jgi:hypothetical protein
MSITVKALQITDCKKANIACRLSMKPYVRQSPALATLSLSLARTAKYLTKAAPPPGATSHIGSNDGFSWVPLFFKKKRTTTIYRAKRQISFPFYRDHNFPVISQSYQRLIPIKKIDE